MKFLLTTVSCVFIVATLLPLIKKDHWMIRAFDFPHVQITIINVVLFVLQLVFLDTNSWIDISVTVALALCILYQCVIIFPYTPIASPKIYNGSAKEVKEGISLMVTNVLMDNKHAEKCIKIIQHNHPDVLLMIETNQWWKEQIRDVVEKEYEYRIEYPLENTYGMLLYAKFPLKDSDIKFLIKKDIPSFHTTLVLPSGLEIFLHCIHPEPPAPTQSEYSTERDAELLIVGKEIINPAKPTIVAGDLNDVAWSYTTRLFIKISQLLDPRMGRGFFSTFHAGYPLMRWPLDHVFLSSHFKLLDIQRLPYYGSDHFPIFIKIGYNPDIKQDQKPDEPDEDAEEMAQEKIEKVEE